MKKLKIYLDTSAISNLHGYGNIDIISAVALIQGMNDMTLQEILEIKARKSQVIKDMTTEQLNEYYTDSLQEFCKITGKQLKKESYGYIRGAEYSSLL